MNPFVIAGIICTFLFGLLFVVFAIFCFFSYSWDGVTWLLLLLGAIFILGSILGYRSELKKGDHCPVCNKFVYTRYCEYCGTEINPMFVCPGCEEEYDKKVPDYCPNCGEPLAAEIEEEAAE